VIKVIIVLSVAAVVPAFFIFLWLSSSYHRLNALRNQCDRLREAIDPNRRDTSKAYDEAVRKYNAARLQFPAKLFAGHSSLKE
jgi:hypothetical protein